ncbi:MAG TPA: DNA-binding protein WhiA [Ruminiclostridium sp.]|nr:DNA-binding protein WhiA [Ruminiclostridium sp.]
MTFAYKVKTELCSVEPSSECCKKAEMYGFLLYGRMFSKTGISVQTEHFEVAVSMAKLLSNLFDIEPAQKTSRRADGRITDCISIENESKISYIFDSFGHGNNKVALRINRANIENECCSSSFLKGVFLSCGSIVDPEKDYHLEFVSSHLRLGQDFADYLSELGFEPKTIVRKGNFVVYLKDSEQIEDILTLMGAVHCSLELMNIKVYKDLRNKVNRVTNCETANITKTVDAAARQLEAINKLTGKKGYGCLPEELREIAKLRLDNPDASLSELAKMAGISRSGVNHRLQRILNLAEKATV